MRIGIDTSAWQEAKWSQYAIRFLFGGLVTAATGVIGHRYGPVAGGLFLAFPAIFPASATLIEKHQEEKKQGHGMKGTMRGRQLASVDAAGAAMGSLGLMVFAWLVWKLIFGHEAAMVLLGATGAWFAVGVSVWFIRKHLASFRRSARARFENDRIE